MTDRIGEGGDGLRRGTNVTASNDSPLHLSRFTHRCGAVLHSKCSKPCREFETMAELDDLRVALQQAMCLLLVVQLEP